MTQTTTDLETAISEFYEALDANDPDAFERHLAADAVFVVNDGDAVAGVQQIAEFVAAWKANFNSVIHDISRITADPTHERAGVETVVSYVFPDDGEVKVKGCSFLDFSDGRITGWRVYTDVSRLS